MPKKKALHESLSREFSLTQRETTTTLLESAAKRNTLEGFFSDDEEDSNKQDVEGSEDKKVASIESYVEPSGLYKNTSSASYSFSTINGLQSPLSNCFISRDDAYAVLSHGLLCDYCMLENKKLPPKLVEELFSMIYKAPDRSLAEVAARAFCDIYLNQYFSLSISPLSIEIDENAVCGWNSWCTALNALLQSHSKQWVLLNWTNEEMCSLLVLFLRLSTTPFGYMWSSLALSATIDTIMLCIPSASLENMESVIRVQKGVDDVNHNLKILRGIPPSTHCSVLLQHLSYECLKTMHHDIYDTVPPCLISNDKRVVNGGSIINACALQMAESYSSSNYSLYTEDYRYLVSVLDIMHTALLREYTIEEGDEVMQHCTIVSNELRKRASRDDVAFEISDRISLMELKWSQEKKRRNSFQTLAS